MLPDKTLRQCQFLALKHSLDVAGDHLGGVRIRAVAHDADAGLTLRAGLAVKVRPEAERRGSLAFADPVPGRSERSVDLADGEVLVALDPAYDTACQRVTGIPDHIDDGVADIRAYREAEQDDLHHRHHQNDQGGPEIPEYVSELFLYERYYLSHASLSAFPAIFVNTSSMSLAP